jgi:hypothetical protein
LEMAEATTGLCATRTLPDVIDAGWLAVSKLPKSERSC